MTEVHLTSSDSELVLCIDRDGCRVGIATGGSGRRFGGDVVGPPHLYAASCRWRRKDKQTLLETWSHALTLGQALPTLPLWLSEDLAVPLDLEQSYEQACNDLWIS